MFNARIMLAISRRHSGPMTRLRMMKIFQMSDQRIDCALFHRVGTRHGGKSQKWHAKRFVSRVA